MGAKHTTESVRAAFRERGVEPTFAAYVNPKEKLSFRCGCGKPGEVAFINFQYQRDTHGNPVVPRCKECQKAFKKEVGKTVGLKTLDHAPKHTDGSVRALFAERGAKLLTKYKGYDSPLTYRCACGEHRVVTLESVVEAIRKNPGHVIRCQKCAHKGYRPSSNPSLDALMERFPAAFAKWNATPLEPYPGKNDVPIRFRCECGQEHEITWNAMHNPNNTPPRCPACHDANRPRGETHPNWNPELSEADRKANEARGWDFMVWAKAIKVRDHFRCAITGENSNELESHHLYSWSDYPDRRFDLRNGVTLSVAAHARFHARYGRKGNTFAQFAEFYMAETGRPCPFADPYGE